MILLALETATMSSGVAALQQNEDGSWRVLASRASVVSKRSEALLVLVDEVLREIESSPRALGAVACDAGPGSFTGLRIGLATAKGLCFALGKPLVLVSSLAALAARAPEGQHVAAILDAHKDEVYAGLFVVEGGVPRPLGEEAACPPARLAAQLRAFATTVGAPLALVGDGLVRYPELLVPGAHRLDDEGAPRAADVGRLAAHRLARGEADDLARAAPRYLRPSEAELVKLASLQKSGKK